VTMPSESATAGGPPDPDLIEHRPGVQNPDGKRPRTLTITLVLIVVALVVISGVLVVQYTVPTVRTERTSVEPIGWAGATQGIAPAIAQYWFVSTFFCAPTNIIGNLTVSVVWQSSAANTTAVFFYGGPNVFHFVYWVNNSAQGGYSFPPALSAFLCSSGNSVVCHWYTAVSGAEITLGGIREYNYTALGPAW